MKTAYSRIRPIERAIPADRQGYKRHYGVHPYFTRRPPNVVRYYVLHYSQPGTRVLDPFGGSGVTAIEAMLTGRQGIHNDINPIANFIAEEIADLSQPNTDYVRRALAQVEASHGEFVRRIPSMSDAEVDRHLGNVCLPENIRLPGNSDVPYFFELFTPRQLLALAALKEGIDKVRDEAANGQLLLAWSATVGKLNRTFLSAKGRAESRGGSSIFSIYRYKIAATPVELAPWETFVERVTNVIKAKDEILKEKRYLEAQGRSLGSFECHSKDVLELPDVLEPVDYIFTDPPYGGHIAYLDLSTLWNHWLGLRVSAEARKKEIIVGGVLRKSEEDYLDRLRSSIKACLKLLRDKRWLSVVFQHWNIAYFEAILEAAEENGAELQATVTQAGDTIWSMHKKKNPERVLSGEMILTFFKDSTPRRRTRMHRLRSTCDIEELVEAVLPGVANGETQLHGEVLFNRLISEAWKRKALHALRISREEFLDLLRRRGWQYDTSSHCWTRHELVGDRNGRLAF